MAIAGSEELKWDGDELASKLEEVISTLPDKQRLVFELKYYQELSYEEMAELTQTSVGALKASYHHAKQKIGNQLIQALNLP
jgi:RNA polymerase sigma-70 factor (ECF subfamily)